MIERMIQAWTVTRLESTAVDNFLVAGPIIIIAAVIYFCLAWWIVK